MAEMRAAVEVGLDGFFHEPHHGLMALIRSLVDADNVLVVQLERFINFRLKNLNR